jgi:hypothetical protein
VVKDSNRAQVLATLLQEAGARPRVSPERVVRSTLYDLDYHIAIVACVFFTNAEQRTDNTRSIVAQWLRILQFVAVRPALLPDFLQWAKERRNPDLNTWQKMPRGYLGDRTHERTIEWLVAGEVLYRAADSLIGGERFNMLRGLYERIVANRLFASERLTLRALASVPVNKTLLRGK